MTDFAETVRHRCRNKNCRKNLPAPTANDRHAFHSQWCHEAFYSNRCLVCEKPLPPGSRSNRKLCKRPKCRNAYSQNRAFYDFPTEGSQNKSELSKTPVKGPVLDRTKRGRAIRWKRFSAGPTLTPSQLHCAVIPDGPDNQWAGGSIERIEAANRRALEAHFDKLDSTAIDYCSVCGRNDDLVDYKVADQWVTTCRECRATRSASATATAGLPSDWKPSTAALPIADNLEIPAFLRRTGGDR